MPELPEVQSVVDALAPEVVGRTIASVDLRRHDIVSLHAITRLAARKKSPRPAPPDLAPLLTGRTITRLYRRAKRIVFALGDDAHLYIHLGMTGHLSLPSADLTHHLPHTHLLLQLHAPARPPATLAFSDPRRFGHVVYLPPGSPPDTDLGPEPFTLSSARFHRLLTAARRPLKSALLDQTLLAGLGNIYVDESLHAAGLHPLAHTAAVTPAQSQALLRAIKRILRRAIAARGSTLRDYRTPGGDAGSFQLSHRVYDRVGDPCRTCRTPIVRIVHAQRSTHFCPRCQPPCPR